MKGVRRCVAAVVGVSLLVGCSTGTSGIDTTTSGEMQATVLAIAVSAATGAYPAAVTQLDGLQSRLDQALSTGQVGRDRGARIQAAIDQVRADLGGLVPMPVPVPSSSPTVAAAPSPDSAKPSASISKHKAKSKD